MLYQYETKWDSVVETAFMDNPFTACNTFAYQEQMADVTAQWLQDKEPWQSFFSFTYRDEVSKEQAIRDIRYWIRLANEIKFGHHYTRYTHHSYFSYVLGMERQERGVIHYHMCIDREIDFKWIHWYWNLHHGFAWIRKIEDLPASLHYTVKYAVKEGEAWFYLR